MHKFTIFDNIIRYIYKETDNEENKKINYTLYRYPELKRTCDNFNETCNYLGCAKASPCDKIISNIINYSRKINTFEASNVVNLEHLKN